MHSDAVTGNIARETLHFLRQQYSDPADTATSSWHQSGVCFQKLKQSWYMLTDGTGEAIVAAAKTASTATMVRWLSERFHDILHLWPWGTTPVRAIYFMCSSANNK